MTELPHIPDSFMPLLHLLYVSPAVEIPGKADLNSRMEALGFAGPEDIALEWDIRTPEKCLGALRFADHRIQVAGLCHPLPPDMRDRTINVSPWQAQIKASMRQHQSHLSLVYRGAHPDPVEKMIALYQAANAFQNENLLGLANEPAWTAHPSADFLSAEKISRYRHDLPFLLWFGNIRVFVDPQRYWLVTKGYHIFDVPDLAYFIESPEEEAGIMNDFINLFYYLYHKDASVTAGDTLEIGETGEVMRFSEVTEFPETLLGPSGTLVIEKMNHAQGNGGEINLPGK